MTYIPVGTLLTYTATVQTYLTRGYTTWNTLAAALKNDLQANLPGEEELDVEASNGTNSVISLSNTFSLSIQVLNNGVDHGSETDIQAIIDGVIQGYGNQVVSSSITNITLPNNPGDDINQGQTISTGAISNAPLPQAPTTSSFSLSKLIPTLGTTGTLTTGLVILIVAIFALILLLPGGFGRAVRAVR